jgi:hypothetical protein
VKAKQLLTPRHLQMLAADTRLRMHCGTFLGLCIDFAGELSGSHLVTSGLQLRQIAGESGEEDGSYT